jgi:hypothetical protein
LRVGREADNLTVKIKLFRNSEEAQGSKGCAASGDDDDDDELADAQSIIRGHNRGTSAASVPLPPAKGHSLLCTSLLRTVLNNEEWRLLWLL